MKYTKEQKEQQKTVREEHKRFNDFMKDNGWSLRILFMRGVKWIKEDDTIIIDINGYHWNDVLITEEEMKNRLGYKGKL